MDTDELSRLYRSIDIPDDSVDRVISALPRQASGGSRHFSRPRTSMFALTASALGLLIAAVVIFGLRSTTGDHPSTVHEPTISVAPAPQAVLPPKQPNTLSGAVLRDGRPVKGAQIEVQIQPNQQIMSHLKKGDTVPSKNLPVVTTDSHGSFVVTLSKAVLANPRYVQDKYVNFEVDVASAAHGTVWFDTFEIHNHSATPIRMTFDLGAQKIEVDGKESKLPVY